MRLLIAEDDTRLLKSLKHIFEANQYMVDAVSNGMDALAYAESEEYDGLIFDIMMPGMDGVEVLKRLREKGVGVNQGFKRFSISFFYSFKCFIIHVLVLRCFGLQLNSRFGEENDFRLRCSVSLIRTWPVDLKNNRRRLYGCAI